MQLTTITAAAYARDVLPESQLLWGQGRSFDEYAGEFLALAGSAYGRRRFRALGLRIDGLLVASCKRYEREIRCGGRLLQAAGIGAVFTPSPLRGRGYASALIGTLLDTERAAGIDVAYLFSDIHPVFYERLGFIALPSRTLSLRADTLPATRLKIAPIGDGDWPAVRRCFELLDGRRPFAFKRGTLEWDRFRVRCMRRGAGQTIALSVRNGRGVSAYLFGQRLPTRDAFVLEEFGYTGDDGFDAVAPLIRSAAGDLRRVTGWLPPDVARRAIARGAVKKRKSGITMLALLSQAARSAWRQLAPTIMTDDADRCWEFDHI